MAQARYRRGNGHPAKSPFYSTLGGSPTGIFRTPVSGVLRGPRTPGPLAPPPAGGSRVSVSGLGSRSRVLGDLGSGDLGRRWTSRGGLDIWRDMTSGLIDICPSRGLATEGPPRDVAHAAPTQSPGAAERYLEPVQGFKGPQGPRAQPAGFVQHVEPPKEVGDDPTSLHTSGDPCYLRSSGRCSI